MAPAKRAASAARRAGRSRTEPGALLLTPGAGADRTHHTLVAVERAVKQWRKVAASRIDFPYRKAGKGAPDKAPVAVAHLAKEAAKLVKRAGCAPDQLVLGGRSYGGRMCSLAVAEGLPAAGLVLLSYPLHPPGKPDNLRVEHFPDITVPVLFISGEKDAFGSKAEFDRHVKKIAGPVTQIWIPGGHDPRNQDDRIATEVVTWLGSL